MATGTGGSLVKRWRSKLGHNKISYHDTAAEAAEAYALARAAPATGRALAARARKSCPPSASLPPSPPSP
eukprot:1947783-Prymnesium_polylepis.1